MVGDGGGSSIDGDAKSLILHGKNAAGLWAMTAGTKRPRETYIPCQSQELSIGWKVWFHIKAQVVHCKVN